MTLKNLELKEAGMYLNHFHQVSSAFKGGLLIRASYQFGQTYTQPPSTLQVGVSGLEIVWCFDKLELV